MKNLFNEEENNYQEAEYEEHNFGTFLKRNIIIAVIIITIISLFIWQKNTFENKVEEAKNIILTQSWKIEELKEETTELSAPLIYLDNLIEKRLLDKSKEEKLKEELKNLSEEILNTEAKIRCWREATWNRELNCEEDYPNYFL